MRLMDEMEGLLSVPNDRLSQSRRSDGVKTNLCSNLSLAIVNYY
jgi:hypothetical protein